MELTKNQAVRLLQWHYTNKGVRYTQDLANKYLLDRRITVQQYIWLVRWTEGRV